MRSATMRWIAGAVAVMAAVAVAAPASADPPWERGWRKHGHGRYWGPPVAYYPPPRVYYAPPPVVYAPPPPVYYAPPAYVAPGLSFGINIPLR